MRYPQCIILASMVGFLLTSCTSECHSPTQMASNFINRQEIIPTSNAEYPAKNPETVALYQDNQFPHAPYRVIGMASIARRNLLGMERSNDTMQTMMKQLAANIGGDGLININNNSDAMKAHVIAYQKILI